MKRRLLVTVAITTALLTALNLWLQGAAGVAWVLQRGATLAGASLQIEAVSELDGTVLLHQLRLHRQETAISIGALHLRWQPWRLLGGTLWLEAVHGEDIDITLQDTDSASAPFSGVTLPLRTVLQDLRLQQVDIVRSGEETPRHLDTLILQASLRWRTLAIQQLTLRQGTSQLQASGRLATTAPFGLSLQTTGNYQHPQLGELPFTAHFGGSLDQLQGKGRLNVIGSEYAGSTLAWRGHYQDRRITLKELSVAMPQGQGRAQFQASLDWHQGPLQYRVDGHLQQLQWPPGRASLQLDSGTVSVSGNDTVYRLSANATLTGDQLPRSSWQLQGRGEGTQLEMESLIGHLLGGTLTARGRLNHHGGWRWDGELHAEDIDPAREWPAWPGKLNGAASVKGSYRERIELTVPQLRVDGILRSQPVSLSSEIQLDGEELRIEALEASAGGSRLRGRLTAGKSVAGRFKLSMPDLAQHFPGASGSLEARLDADGPREQPRLNMQLSTTQVGLGHIRTDALTGQATLGLGDHLPWTLQAKAAGFSSGFGEHAPLALSLQGHGTGSEQQLALEAANETQELSAQVDGSWRAPQWQGAVTRLKIADPDLGHWQQQRPFGLLFSADELHIDQACLTSAPAHACFSYRRDATATQQLQLSLQQFNLQRLGTLTAEYATLQLPLSAEMDLSLTAQAPPSGQLQLELGSGTIRTAAASMPTLAAAPIEVDSGRLTLTADAGNIEAGLQLQLPSGDRLHGKGRMQLEQGWREQPFRQALQASLKLELESLRLLTLLPTPLEEPQGSLTAELQATGYIAAPLLTGHLALKLAQAKLPRLGLSLHDAEFTANSQDPGRLLLSAVASSGQGRLQASGHFSAAAEKGWTSTLHIKGERFEVSNIPEARISVSPSLTLRAEPSRIDIDGEVGVDEARLEPRDLTLAVTPSKDVVIVGPQQQPPSESRWQVFSNIRLHAADTIHLKGFGFSGYLGGDVRLIDEPNRAPRAQGELHLVPGARYRAFGQDLSAEHGRIYYADTPLDNPSLDINAVRTVGDVVAGVKVEGTALDPRLTLFSRPSMDQVDILAYLTLGRPFSRAGVNDGNTMREAAGSAGLAGGDYLLGRIGSRFDLDEARLESKSDSGEPWLVIGRYLSPRLYVRYGVGLVESGSSLIMRYQLSKSWSLQGEVGQESGSDLIYTIERP